METTRQTIDVRRSEVAALLDDITKNPAQIFSVECARRDDLYLRYPPVAIDAMGHLCYDGDCTDIVTREFIRITKKGERRFAEFTDCCPNAVDARGNIRRKAYGLKDSKTILEPKGTFRRMLCKRKLTDAPTKHWAPKPDGKRNYNPADHDLFQVAGMYNDNEKAQPTGGKRIGRFGQWRPWAQVCLRTIRLIRNKGIDYNVVDDVPTQLFMDDILLEAQCGQINSKTIM